MPSLPILSEIAGTVWKIVATVGENVAAETDVIILESMKMEIPIAAPAAGVMSAIPVKEGDAVAEGQHVATLET